MEQGDRQRRGSASPQPVNERADSHLPWLPQITAVIAHDLGNAMTAVAFGVDAMGGDAQGVEHDEMRSALARASSLVRLLARLSAAASTPLVRLDVREVVADVAPVLQRIAQGSLRVELPEAPAPIIARRSDVERALIELVLAVGTPADASDVLLAVERESEGGIRIALEAAASDVETPLELSRAHELAEACGGSLIPLRSGEGGLRIELSLPAGQPIDPKRW